MSRVPASQLVNPQQMTVTVAGPDGANTMYIMDGQVNAQVGAGNAVPVTQTYSILLGPVLTRKQFVQAIGTASLTGLFFTGGANSQFNSGINITNIDADWDDESGQVELRVEFTVTPSQGGGATLMSLSYHVTALAQM